MKTLKIALAAALAVCTLAAATGCACDKTPSSAPLTPSTVSAASSVPAVSSAPINADFTSHKFELRLYKTTNWSTFKAVSPKTTVVFSLSFPTGWARSEGDAELYTTADGAKIMEIETPIQLAKGAALPELPAKSGSKPAANEAVTIAGISGRLLIWDDTADENGGFRYAYFMKDGDIVYRVTFFASAQSAEKRALFDAVIDKLTNGK